MAYKSLNMLYLGKLPARAPSRISAFTVPNLQTGNSHLQLPSLSIRSRWHSVFERPLTNRFETPKTGDFKKIWKAACKSAELGGLIEVLTWKKHDPVDGNLLKLLKVSPVRPAIDACQIAPPGGDRERVEF